MQAASTSATTPVTRDLVLLGGGHSHLAVLRRFAMAPMPGVRLTLVTRDVHTPYSGMLPGFVAGHYALDECHIDLRPLARMAGARLVHASASGLDLDARRVVLGDRSRPAITFDYLSIDIGGAPDRSDIAGADAVGIAVKPIDAFVAWLETLDATCEQRLVVVGGGAGGVELVLALDARLRRVAGNRVRLALVSAADSVLPDHNRRVQRIFARTLADRGIELHLGAPVVRADADRLVTADGATIWSDAVVWATGVAPAPWLAESGLEVDARGFVVVDATLRSPSHPFVFAAGDVASNLVHPRPKSGVFAVRQGPPLADNLQRVLRGEPPRAFRPQRQFLSLIGTGDGRAVASRGPFAAHGASLWRLKERIDRRFVARFSTVRPAVPEASGELPLASAQDLSMRCAGCGSKVGQDVLERALARARALVGGERVAPDACVVVGLDAPDDAAVLEVPPGMLVVQSVDGFRALVDDPWLLGRIATNHALGDLWAMGATPRAALALATVPYASEAKVEEELAQMLAGVLVTLDEAGATLVGGHTTEGPEAFLALQVIGFSPAERVWRKRGLEPGQALVLTRSIGTGVLFAAEMRGLARGRDIEAALRAMTRSSADAAACLREHGATAVTDVTGFGLLGHLLEMLRASGSDAQVELAAVPHYAGALELATRGVSSTLTPQNLRSRRAVENHEAVAADPRYALLFDPQTAGGLLAGLDAERAGACVAALRALGHTDAAVIGRVTARRGAGPGVVVVAGERGEAGR